MEYVTQLSTVQDDMEKQTLWDGTFNKKPVGPQETVGVALLLFTILFLILRDEISSITGFEFVNVTIVGLIWYTTTANEIIFYLNTLIYTHVRIMHY